MSLIEILQRLEALEAENAALKARIQVLETENAALKAENERLRSQLSKNSQNSSRPPSTDAFNRPKPKSLREKSGKLPGGQEGRTGKTLQQVSNPDELVIHSASRCSGCEASLENVEGEIVATRQVFEIPQPKVEVVEHRCLKKTCASCGKQNTVDFPAGVEQLAQYGPRTKGLITYLQNYQLIPYERLTELFADVFGIKISEGTIFNTAKTAYQNLASFEEHTKQLLLQSPTLNADETGVDINKKLHWLHSVSTDRLTFHHIHEKRGSEAMDAGGVLPQFKGTVVHDCWSPYFKYDFAHALCNAHLLRELNAVIENSQEQWAKDMQEFLRKANKASKGSEGSKCLSEAEIKELEKEYREIISRGYVETGGPLPEEKSSSRNLWERFVLRQHQVLRFIYDASVPFDNNLAERDIRMVKVKEKISGCFRSLAGAQQHARIRSYISTVKKQAADILNQLQNVFTGDPFTPTA